LINPLLEQWIQKIAEYCGTDANVICSTNEKNEGEAELFERHTLHQALEMSL
jgi:hypothetical protein